jgi:hypothetical protein
MINGIIFLHKDKFDFFERGLTKIIEFRFVSEIVRDLEVVNAELLENLIKLFVTGNQAVPSEVAIVVADNASFVKDFSNPQVPSQPGPGNLQASQLQKAPADNSESMESEINDFIENVPFESVSFKKFPTATGMKVIAVNKDLYEAVKVSFEKTGFKVSGVYPGLIFGGGVGSKISLDIVTFNQILQQVETLREHNFLIEEKVKQTAPPVENGNGENQNYTVPEQDTKAPAKTDKKRLFIMLSVFAVLIAILVYLIFNPPS